MDEKNRAAGDANKPTEKARERGNTVPQRRPEKSGKQGKGPEWTGEGDSSVERGQRAGPPSEEGGSQWPHKG
jgi:hypothetical protein